MSQWIEKDIGKCLTQYKHKEYDKLVSEAEGFVTLDQWTSDKPDSQPLTTNPKCGAAEICFALIKGEYIEIMKKIDSSD